MKLHVKILEKLVELPTKDIHELRQVLDDLGLEVKGIDGEGEHAVFNDFSQTLANRGDTLSALGVAREISARYLSSIKYPAIASDLDDRKASIAARVTTKKCLRYAPSN